MFTPINGIAVAANQLVDAAGNPVQLHGVNRMSTEYACILNQGYGIFDGPSTFADNDTMLDIMAQKWNINALRVPVNEDCWLGSKDGLNPAFTGPTYADAITQWVTQITGKGMVAILDLHWAAPKGVAATGQQPMANADNSPRFWALAANAFMNNGNVIFDLFNEPYLDRDTTLVPPTDAWDFWRDGCQLHVHDDAQNPTAAVYQAAGMQQLVDAVRNTGATNPIMLGGLAYCQDLSGLVAHLPNDPANQLIASFHPYPGNPCKYDDSACLGGKINAVLASIPVVAGEFGRDDCTTDGLADLMGFLDANGVSYLAWVWTVTNDVCGNGKYDLIQDYLTFNPTVTGGAIQAHYLAL